MNLEWKIIYLCIKYLRLHTPGAPFENSMKNDDGALKNIVTQLFLCDQPLFVKAKMIDVVRIGAGSRCPYKKILLNIEWII